jgi:hypothetical protein
MAHRFIPLTPPLFFHFTLPLMSTTDYVPFNTSIAEHVLVQQFMYLFTMNAAVRVLVLHQQYCRLFTRFTSLVQLFVYYTP